MRDEVLQALCELGSCVIIEFEGAYIALEYTGNGKWGCDSMIYSEMVWRDEEGFDCTGISWNINSIFDEPNGDYGKMTKVIISSLCGDYIEYKL